MYRITHELVYRASHVHPHPADRDLDVSLDIGIYSTRDIAEEAVNRLRKQRGFADYPDGFFIDAMELDVTAWDGGYFIS